MDMTPQRWQFTNQYMRQVFGRADAALSDLMREEALAGLPDIAVRAECGRLLFMLAVMVRARLVIELGTLGGYSTIWLARAMAPGGRLITIESEPKHADFAQRQFEHAGVSDRIEIRPGAALDVLPQLRRQLAPETVDLVFLDAIKAEYPDYWRLVRPMIKVGGLIVADNVFGSGEWWIDDVDHPSRRGADEFNRLVASDPSFQAVAFPMRQGVLVGRRME